MASGGDSSCKNADADDMSKNGRFSFPIPQTCYAFNYFDQVSATWESYAQNSTGALFLFQWRNKNGDPWSLFVELQLTLCVAYRNPVPINGTVNVPLNVPDADQCCPVDAKFRVSFNGTDGKETGFDSTMFRISKSKDGPPRRWPLRLLNHKAASASSSPAAVSSTTATTLSTVHATSTLPPTSNTALPTAQEGNTVTVAAGVIVGVVIGAVACLMFLLLIGAFFCLRRRKRKKMEAANTVRQKSISPEKTSPKEVVHSQQAAPDFDTKLDDVPDPKEMSNPSISELQGNEFKREMPAADAGEVSPKSKETLAVRRGAGSCPTIHV